MPYTHHCMQIAVVEVTPGTMAVTSEEIDSTRDLQLFLHLFQDDVGVSRVTDYSSGNATQSANPGEYPVILILQGRDLALLKAAYVSSS